MRACCGSECHTTDNKPISMNCGLRPNFLTFVSFSFCNRSGTNLQYKLHKPTLDLWTSGRTMEMYWAHALLCPAINLPALSPEWFWQQRLTQQDLSCLWGLSASQFIFLQLPAVRLSSHTKHLHHFWPLYTTVALSSHSWTFLYFTFSLLPAPSRKSDGVEDPTPSL